MGIGLCVLMCTLIHVFSLHAFSFLPFLPLSVRVCVYVCVCARASSFTSLSVSLFLSLAHSHSLSLSLLSFLPPSLRVCVYVCVCVRIILVFSLHRSWTKEIGDKGGLVYMYTRATPSRDSTLPPLP